MTIQEKILDKLMETSDIDICSQYGEDGYTLEEDKKAILFANWNKFDKHPNFMQWIQENYEIEWSDEWIIDYNNSKAYRTSPDSYGWQQQVKICDGYILTPDDDIVEWIKETEITFNNLTNTPNVLPYFIDTDELIKEGYKLLNDDLEHGMYGRTDEPSQIAENLLNEGFNSILFYLDSVGQFSMNFSVYVKR